MFISDSPINEKSNDILNRYHFVKNISNSIMTIDAKDGMCLSIQGPWGSGKTSVINLIVDYIKSNYNNKDSHIIFFTPWNFVSTEDLFIQFFTLLADSFSDGKQKKDIKIAEELKKYIGLIDSISPGLKFASLLATALNASVSNRNPFDSSNLQKQRNLIVDLLKKQKRKIIVVIDDLDRLTDDEIRLVFQLVNSVAKFPNVIYLLAYDKNVVVNALNNIQSSDGEKYLEKIVQVPISLPEINSKDIESYLLNNLNKIIYQYNYSFDKDYWSNVYFHIIYGKLYNIREAIRLINILIVKCTLVGIDINIVDLIAISYIELYCSDLYDWIKDNRKIITHSAETFLMSYRTDAEYSDALRSNLKSINEELYDDYKTILDIIFPGWDIKYIYDTNTLRRQQRIAHGDYVDRYFCFEIDESALSRNIVNQFLFSETYEEMVSLIESVKNNDDQIRFLIKEIAASITELDDDRKINISKALIDKSSALKNDNQKGIFDFSTRFMTVAQIENLLRNVSDRNLVLNMMLESIKSADVDRLTIFADIINTNELALGRLAANGQKRPDCVELISVEHIEACEKAFIERIIELNKTTDILDANDSLGLYMILYLYESFDIEAFNSFINELKEDNHRILKYIRIFANRIIGTDGISWTYKDEYSNYISYDEAKSAYNECLKDGSIIKLSEDIIKSAVVFELWFSKPRNANDRIKDSTVEARKKEILNSYNKLLEPT